MTVKLRKIEWSEIPEKWIPNWLNRPDYHGDYKIIEYDNQDVGFLMYAPLLDYCVVDTIFIDPDYRRNGIASKVNDLILQEYPKIVCQLTNDIGAKSFLESLGVKFNKDNNWWESYK